MKNKIALIITLALASSLFVIFDGQKLIFEEKTQFFDDRIEYKMKGGPNDPKMPPYIYRKDCQSEERVPSQECGCPDGYYDNGIDASCQICPYPVMNCYNSIPNQIMCENRAFINLDQFFPQEKIDYIDDYLLNKIGIFDRKDMQTDFTTKARENGDQIFLSDRPPYFKEAMPFRTGRRIRQSPHFWRLNKNAEELSELMDFLKEADMFEYFGAITVILTPPNLDGVFHRDHSFTDLASEFIWLRGNRSKQFFVRDPMYNNERSHITSYVTFFDDWYWHNTSPTPYYTYSIRVDGKFKPHVREYIAEYYHFEDNSRRNTFLNNTISVQPYFHDDESFVAQINEYNRLFNQTY